MIQGTLLLGGAGTGKTTYILKTYLEKAHAHPQASSILLFPNNSQVEHSKELILRLPGMGGYWVDTIVTFHSLAKKFINPFEYSNIVSRTGQDLIVSRILDTGNYPFLEPASKSPGFRATFLSMVKHLKSECILPDDFRFMHSELSDEMVIREKWDELGALYQDYQNFLLQHNLRDQEDLLISAVERIERHPDTIKGIDHLLIDGFHDFTLIERKILEFLFSQSRDVLISLLYDPDHGSTELWKSSLRVYKWVKRFGMQEKILTKNYRTTKQSLQNVSKRLFSVNTELPQCNTDIEFFAAGNRRKEIDAIAREILFYVKQGTYRYQDFLIIFRRIEPYYAILTEIFLRYGIPFRIFASQHLRSSKPARIILDLLSMISSGWQEMQTIRFLRTAASLDNLDDVDTITIAVKRRAGCNGIDDWLKLIKTLDCQWVWDLFNRIRDWYDTGKGLSQPEERCGHMKELLYRMFERYFEDVVKQNSMNPDTREYNQALKALFQIADDIQHYYIQTEKTTFNTLLKIYKDQIQQYTFHSLHRKRSVVNVIDVLESRQWEKKVVFAAGMVEREFPLHHGSQAFWTEHERLACNRSKKIVIPGIPDIVAEEQFLFYVALTRAQEKLYVSFPSCEDTGKELVPSFFLKAFIEHFDTESKALKPVYPSSFSKFPCGTEILTLRDRTRHVFPCLVEEDISDNAMEIKKALYYQVLQDQSLFQLLKQFLFPHSVTLDSKDIHTLLCDKNTRYSASRLDTFAVCPYRHFASYILGIELPSDIDRKGLTPLEEGILVHRVIELYFKNNKKRSIEDIFNKEYKSIERRFRFTIEDDRKRKNMLECLHAFADFEESLPDTVIKPHYFEFRFGTDRENAVSVDRNDSTQIFLTGKIDRIDVYEDDTRKAGVVIDYKYSKQAGKWNLIQDIEEGMSFQLPFYMIAQEQQLGLQPLAGIIYSIVTLERYGIASFEEYSSELTGKIYPNIKLKQTDLAALLDKVRQHIIEYTDAIASGEIALQTTDPSACGIRNCDFTDLCRSQLNKKIIQNDG